MRRLPALLMVLAIVASSLLLPAHPAAAATFRNRIAQMTLEATRVADRTINSLIAAAKSAKTA